MPESIDKMEEELRKAILDQRFSEVQQLARAYGEAVEAWMRSLAPDDPRISQIAARVREVLQIAVSAVRLERDRLALELAQFPKVRCFFSAGFDRPFNVRFNG